MSCGYYEVILSTKTLCRANLRSVVSKALTISWEGVNRGVNSTTTHSDLYPGAALGREPQGYMEVLPKGENQAAKEWAISQGLRLTISQLHKLPYALWKLLNVALPQLSHLQNETTQWGVVRIKGLTLTEAHNTALRTF